MGSRFLLAVLVLKLLGRGYTFLLDGYHRLPLTAHMQSFDFSSAQGWDEFYKEPEKYDSTTSQETAETTATEWHPSVSLESIASAIPPNGRCLIIGCGNSNLPDVILKQRDCPLPRSLVLLDTSQTCLNQLRERHLRIEGSSSNDDGIGAKVSFESTEIEYVCGDVTQLSTYFDVANVDESGESTGAEHDGEKDENVEALFDMIIDKGLTDALLCGEGWDGPLEKLMCESAKILSKETGQYLLISYELPSSTKRFLAEIGNEVGLKWDFDFDSVTSASQDVNVAMGTIGNPLHHQSQSS